jgi:hypothetical protein
MSHPTSTTTQLTGGGAYHLTVTPKKRKVGGGRCRMSLEYACIFSVGLLHLQQTGRKITVFRETSFIRGRPESGSAFIISYERVWGISAGDRPAPEPEQVRA